MYEETNSTKTVAMVVICAKVIEPWNGGGFAFARRTINLIAKYERECIGRPEEGRIEVASMKPLIGASNEPLEAKAHTERVSHRWGCANGLDRRWTQER